MFYQGFGNKYWKPNLNDPSQAVGFNSLQKQGLSLTGTGLPGSGTAPLPGASGAGAAMDPSSIESLTASINEINQRAQQTANAGRIPGGAGLEGQSSANISSALAGQVDSSTINLLGQQSAERGAMSGSPLGANSNADYLRSLGLTSLDLMNTGQNWLTQATNRNPAAPIYDAGNQVLTAGQKLQAELAREEMANRLRMAMLNPGRGGGGYRGPASGIADTSSNWSPIFGADRQIPTPNLWQYSSPNPSNAFNDYFTQHGGSSTGLGGMNIGTSSIPVTPGVPVQPYQPPFSTNWEDMIFGADDLNSDLGELEDFIYRSGGG